MNQTQASLLLLHLPRLLIVRLQQQALQQIIVFQLRIVVTILTQYELIQCENDLLQRQIQIVNDGATIKLIFKNVFQNKEFHHEIPFLFVASMQALQYDRAVL